MRLILVSVYLPLDAVVAPSSTELRAIVNNFVDVNIELLAGIDANSHHKAYGCSDSTF